jgi:hypothetical protein
MQQRTAPLYASRLKELARKLAANPSPAMAQAVARELDQLASG